ncbi:hypothetical protein DFH09DRAFT_1496893 [Mycena vulgaris]|nr:hypothetical protein DFH09DRAFT_1496893 [Mycena vulgaris]
MEIYREAINERPIFEKTVRTAGDRSFPFTLILSDMESNPPYNWDYLSPEYHTSLSIEVEGRKYVIHRHFLCRDSPVLKNMVQRTASGPDSVLTLDNVTKEEFQHLLWMYYKPHEIETETDDEVPPVVWHDILKLADLWQMTRIKDIAVESWMETELDPAVRITL